MAFVAREPVPEIDTSRIAYVKEQVGYWRKVNAVHKWFVDHCQDGVDECQHSYVAHARLDELLAACKLVLAAKGGVNQDKVIEETLPPTSGFFFGSTEIDEWYWSDIQETADLIEKLKAEPGHKYGSYFYHSSW